VKSGAFLFTVAYGAFLGILAQRAGVPEKIITRTRELIDSETRRTARIMTDEIHARHAELESGKA
jgi:hypothetical protein